MKKLFLRFAILTLAVSAFGAVQLAVSGIGIAEAPDQASADQQADQEAQSNMQGSCAGVIVQSRKTGDQCASLGDSDNPKYMCTVGYVGTCQIGR